MQHQAMDDVSNLRMEAGRATTRADLALQEARDAYGKDPELCRLAIDEFRTQKARAILLFARVVDVETGI